MRFLLTMLGATQLIACGATQDPAEASDDTGVSCPGYPTGASEPMALGGILSPYSWPEAYHRSDGRQQPLDLADAPCNSDPDIDWSPFDVLLFVSIPAW